MNHIPNLNHLSKSFPKFDLQTIERVKTQNSSDLSFFIPKGQKYFAWFTYLNQKPICIFLNYEHNEIQTVHHYYISFKEILSLGTILYGTMMDKKFICENIYYHKGEPFLNHDYLERVKKMNEVMRCIQYSDYLGSISFFLPKISKGRILDATNVPYVVHGILKLCSHPKYYTLNQHLGNFMVKKNMELEDVYELFTIDENNEYVFYSTALVNDFKTSHLMKKVFYKRKKNYKNIEFSDSDEEEENIGVFFVGCLYIVEFKKWKPYVFKTKCADNIRQIQTIEKKIFG